jgi:hypothetical protein
MAAGDSFCPSYDRPNFVLLGACPAFRIRLNRQNHS